MIRRADVSDSSFTGNALGALYFRDVSPNQKLANLTIQNNGAANDKNLVELGSGAIRSGDLKLIEFYDTGTIELYDLSQDIGETRDLAERMPERAAELRTRLKQWREQAPASDLSLR